MPTTGLEPMELSANVTDARLEHRYRPVDAVSHAVRHPLIPRYRNSPDAEIRTTAIPEVT